MTITPIKSSTRATLRRLLKNPHTLLVNANGDITNHETLIRTHPDAPRGTWHTLDKQACRTLLTADEITTSDDAVTVRVGATTTTLDAATSDGWTAELPEVDSDATQLRVRSVDGENRTAFKLLAATAVPRDGFLAVLQAVRIKGSAVGERDLDNADPLVVARSTDRHQATRAVLSAEPADVDAIIAGHLLQEMARQNSWTMTVTGDVTSVAFGSLGIEVSSGNLQEVYPPIERLYPGERSEVSTFEYEPYALEVALKGMEVERNQPVALTCDGTVYAAGTQELLVCGAEGSAGVVPGEVIYFDPRLLTAQAKAAGKQWGRVVLAWHYATKPATVSYGHGIEGLIMPMRDDLPRPGARSVPE